MTTSEVLNMSIHATSAGESSAANVVQLHGGNRAPQPAPSTQDQVIDETAEEYLDALLSLSADQRPGPRSIAAELVARTNNAFDTLNAGLGLRGLERFPRLTCPSPLQLAKILMRLHHVVRIVPVGRAADPDAPLLGIYVPDGPDHGIYDTSESRMRSAARRYAPAMGRRASGEMLAVLRDEAPQRAQNRDRDLVPVDNGIFHYSRKELLPFSPDTVFLAKSRVDYDAHAASPVITNPDGTVWEAEAWMHELSDDDEIVELLWEITGAIVRPHVRWNKSAWFYSEEGNNGKGTLCELMRNLVGLESCASIPVADLGRDFQLEPLLRASAIIVDENDVGAFVERAAVLKALVTNDVVSVNRKGRVPVSFQFWGFMVQCLNEPLRTKDKSHSLVRRQLFVPFTKTFEGRERRYIKDDYLSRPEVLRYVLKRVLHMSYYELSEPDACRALLAEQRVANDPIREFWEEFEEQFVWDLLPTAFLYDLYKSWLAKTNPSGRPVSEKQLQARIAEIVVADARWKHDQIRTASLMRAPEPLIAEYNLVDWRRKNYTGADLRLMCVPDAKDKYRGFRRVSGSAVAVLGGTPADSQVVGDRS